MKCLPLVYIIRVNVAVTYTFVMCGCILIFVASCRLLHIYHQLVSDNALPGVQYSYDLWHVTKLLGKDLDKAAGTSKTKALKQWVPHLKNHFWWSAETCGGNPEVMQASETLKYQNMFGWRFRFVSQRFFGGTLGVR